jgi:AcrR family transcriptional regulator
MASKAYHHGDLRNALIEAGIEIINQLGPEQLSLRKAAARCGVSQAAPYSHFESKEDLLAAMQEHVTKQLMSELQAAVAACPDSHSPEALIWMGKSYVMFFIRHPQYFTFLFSQPIMTVNLSLDSDGERNFPPYELMKSLAISVLGEQLTREKLEDAIISMWATVHGLAALATMKNVRYDKNWESKIVDIIWNR